MCDLDVASLVRFACTRCDPYSYTRTTVGGLVAFAGIEVFDEKRGLRMRVCRWFTYSDLLGRYLDLSPVVGNRVVRAIRALR